MVFCYLVLPTPEPRNRSSKQRIAADFYGLGEQILNHFSQIHFGLLGSNN